MAQVTIMHQNLCLQLRFELMSRSPYSPYLDSCEFIMFPNLAQIARWKASNAQVITETEAYFKEFEKSYYLTG